MIVRVCVCQVRIFASPVPRAAVLGPLESSGSWQAGGTACMSDVNLRMMFMNMMLGACSYVRF